MSSKLSISSYLDDDTLKLMIIDYYQKLNEYISSNLAQGENLISQESVVSIIRQIKTNSAIYCEAKLGKIKKQGLENCNVVFVNGKERLVKKIDENMKGKMKTVIPWDDSFDIIWQMHLENGHPDAQKLLVILQEKYLVNVSAVKSINDVCYICLGECRCLLYVIPMNSNPDFKFNQIMVYQNLNTNFIHLRPISEDTMILEICTMLFEIIMDFGPPMTIVINNILLEEAVHNLNVVLKGNINIRRLEPNYDKIKHITSKIMKWMEKTGSKSWAVGCYMIQEELNNTVIGNDLKSAVERVFQSKEDEFEEQDVSMDFNPPLDTEDVKSYHTLDDDIVIASEPLILDVDEPLVNNASAANASQARLDLQRFQCSYAEAINTGESSPKPGPSYNQILAGYGSSTGSESPKPSTSFDYPK